MLSSNSKIKILIVDDSALVRTIISDLIKNELDMEIVATGKTGTECVELAMKLQPDVITLDIEMPVMDGLTALEEMKKRNIKIPVIMMSVLTQHGAEATFKALELGAIDFVPKPSSGMRLELGEMGDLLKSKIRGYFFRDKKQEITVEKKISGFSTPRKKEKIRAIGIGTSTGGPNALQILFKSIPKNFHLPIFIVQHMPPGFTKAFASRLNSISEIQVKEAAQGDIVQPGCAYIAAGDHHMKLEKTETNISIELDRGEPVNGHRPSIDVTFDSLKSFYGASLVGIIMTGMGRDGAESIKSIHDIGGATIAQDESTSVVFGMNKQAIDIGAIDCVVPVEAIVQNMIRFIEERGI
ncbi:MAG: chemotaxis response regulator protein-glutamate methylesterase [Leptospiraceae bacterium]|nr:chemotaxis response regulator protein-glutamate methylesterase [Leptospiraceae bacterium]MCK6380994.1 chemotaxis response regulator protein-glutamate methylesterase [Leptospiraceae bacterium]NUM40253.1 chemotaxis response regulator protein-glutamate methylesterase [Leptospiraceae bacterium]